MPRVTNMIEGDVYQIGNSYFVRTATSLDNYINGVIPENQFKPGCKPTHHNEGNESYLILRNIMPKFTSTTPSTRSAYGYEYITKKVIYESHIAQQCNDLDSEGWEVMTILSPKDTTIFVIVARRINV